MQLLLSCAMKRSIWQSEYTQLRKALKTLRISKNLTQTELAKQLDKPQSYIAKYERGDRNLDFIEVLEVCSQCGTDPIDFLKTFLQTIK